MAKSRSLLEFGVPWFGCSLAVIPFSTPIKVWLDQIWHLMPLLGSLPKLPVPTVAGTLERYMHSMKPLLSEEEFDDMQKLAKEFETTIAGRLQRYLTLKSWWSTNYVSDWWEEFVYLHARDAIMVNSNFYGEIIFIK